MNRNVLRWLGFTLPTVAVVTVAHLNRDASWGEALDGVVSGLWFSLPFAATHALRSRFETGRTIARLGSPLQDFLLGLLAGALTWAFLWLGWTFPETRSLRPHAFAINSLVTAVAGLVLPGSAGRAETRGTSGALTVG